MGKSMSAARNVGLNKEVGKQIAQQIPNHKTVQKGYIEIR